MEDQGGAFEIVPGLGPEAEWEGGNAVVGVTVFPSPENATPSKMLSGAPALIWTSNRLQPFAQGGRMQRQVMIAELNGVFVHTVVAEGRVRVIVSDKRMDL